ncbi:MAG: type IX secretion system outer membrane channel protein PorV [Bacteroidales bacterium]|nr:type IX secretion system outer membrane channel protein PorV [Bacteroidales bacterium]
MKKNQTALLFLVAAVICLTGKAAAQGYTDYDVSTGRTNNYIPTGIPILQIAPDAISGALGDVGVATTPDAYSSHWNNAKFAFAPEEMSISTTYTPWLRKLDKEMNFLYLGGYKRINNRSAVGASLTYFTLGRIQHTGISGEELGEFNPNEFAADVTYAMKLSDNLSLGATGRFVHSDLTQGLSIEDQTTKAANGLAADVGLYYQQDIDKNQQIALGLHISNLGSKLSYSDDDTENEFLPANLRIGGRYTYEVDDYNKVNFMLDLNKMLVPTPPILTPDSTYSGHYANMTDYRQTSSIMGAFQSFYDAPGGMREELHEVTVGAGAEYWYANTFAARIGYFYEHKTKGARQYLTLGVGVKYNIMVFDFSYLVPTRNFSNNPLANTLRVSIGLNFDNKKKK